MSLVATLIICALCTVLGVAASLWWTGDTIEWGLMLILGGFIRRVKRRVYSVEDSTSVRYHHHRLPLAVHAPLVIAYGLDDAQGQGHTTTYESDVAPLRVSYHAQPALSKSSDFFSPPLEDLPTYITSSTLKSEAKLLTLDDHFLYSKPVKCYSTSGPAVLHPPNATSAKLSDIHVGDTYTNICPDGAVQLWFRDATTQWTSILPGVDLVDYKKYNIAPGPLRVDGSAPERCVLHVRKDGFATWVKRSTGMKYRTQERKEVAMKHQAYTEGWAAAKKDDQRSQVAGPSRRHAMPNAHASL